MFCSSKFNVNISNIYDGVVIVMPVPHYSVFHTRQDWYSSLNNMGALLTLQTRVIFKIMNMFSLLKMTRVFLNLCKCTFRFSSFVDISHFLEYHH